MALSVIQRPDANLYVNDPPQYQEQPYYYSRWSAAFLPLVYKISNTKFPTNTEDAVDTYTAVTNNNGFAKFDLAGTAYQTYIRGEKVTIDGTVYNGVYEVVAIQGDQLTLNVAFSATDTGTANKYYDNYATLIRLYAGVPSYHPYAAQDPMTLVGTFSIAPNLDNVAVVDVADLVRQKISKDNDLSASGRPNDLDAWTCFYIEYAETYDTYTGGIPETVTTNYTEDNLQGITPVSITNGSFTSNLSGWSQIKGIGNGDWIWDSGSAKFPDTGVQSWSKTIYQEVNLKKSIPYKLTLDYQIDNSTGTSALIRVYASNLEKGAFEDIVFYKDITTDISETVVINFTPNKDLKYIGFAGWVSFGSAFVKVNSIALEEANLNYDVAYIFASNSARQFFDYAKNERSRYGGNMAEYVMNYNEQGILGKFLTRFEKPVLFPNYYQDISCILPQSTLDIPFTEDGLLYRVRTLDANGEEVSHTDTEIVNNGDGVYRLRLDNKLGTGKKGDVQLLRTITTPRMTDVYVKGNALTKLYWSVDGNTFAEVTIPDSNEIQGLDVFGNGKAIIATIKVDGGIATKRFYLFDNGTITFLDLSASSTYFVFPFVKAFDENNFVALAQGVGPTPTEPLAYYLNGGLTIKSTSEFDVSNLAAFSMTEVFIEGRPNAQAAIGILKFDGNTIENFVSFAFLSSKMSGDVFKVFGNYIFMIFTKNGDTSNAWLAKVHKTTKAVTEYAIPYLSFTQMDFVSETVGYLTTGTTLYKFDNGSTTTYTDLNSLRTSVGDSSNYTEIKYIGEDVLVITSQYRGYKLLGSWTDMGELDSGGEVQKYSGLFKTQTDTFEISERLPFDIDTTCTNQSMHLSWLNSLGNWEHFVFTAKKSYQKNIDEFTISSNSILANFPDNFDGETYDDKIKVDAFDIVTVRSQYVERKQLDIIAEILQSLRVQYWYSFDKKITVIVDSKSVNKYTDGDRLFAIEFDIIMPKIQTQS